MRKILLLTSFLLTVSIFGHSQTLSVNEDFLKSSTGLQSVTLKNAIVYVSNNSDKQVDVSATDYNLNKMWSVELDGYLHNAENLGGNILILVSTDFTFFTRSNSQFKAYLLDSGTGKILKEKMLFEGNNDYYTIPYSLISKDHKRFTLATRETGLKRAVKIGLGVAALYTIKKMADNGNAIKSFNVTTFDENLEPTEKLSPDLPDGDFVGVQRTINNDLYIAVADNKKGVTISKYSSGKDVSIKTVTEPFSVSGGLLGIDRLNDYINFSTDTINNNTVYISGSFRTDNEFLTIFNRYDFESGNHKKFRKVFTQTDIKDLEKSFTPINKEFKKLELGHPRFLSVKKAVIDETGYYLVISDIQYTPATPNSRPSPYSEGVMFYSLDKDLKEKSLITIPRDYVGMFSAQYELFKQKTSIYLLTSCYNKAKFVAAKINAITGKLENVQIVGPDKAKKADEPNLYNSVLTDAGLILPAWDFKNAFNKIKFDINLYQIRF